MLRRFEMLKRMLSEMGIEPERVRLEWISAAEGEKVKKVVNEMTAQVQKLGPLGVPKKFEEWDQEMSRFEADLQAKQEAKPDPEPAQQQEFANV
jgi:F420-non-reducing hydrogenase iron-sulfur subunit